MCRDVAGHDDNYFFWFLTESYLEPHSVDRLTRSLGFCSAHAARLGRSAGNAYQVAAVHRAIVCRVRRAVAEPVTGRESTLDLVTPAPCPACSSREELVDRAAFWLAEILEDPEHADRYARPGLLCFTHFGAVPSRVSKPVFERLLRIHQDALLSALKSLSETQPDLVPALRLLVGPGSVAELPRADVEPDPAASARDPIGDLLAALRDGEHCPVCLEVRRAWIERTRWLDGAASRDLPIQDLMPTCPEHITAIAAAGGPRLVLAAVRCALHNAGSSLELAARVLLASPEIPRYRRIRRLVEVIAGPRQRLRQAQVAVARTHPCPTCHALDVAADRRLALLFALVEDRHHRAALERSDGLCLKHLSRALALAPPAPIRSALLEIEAARLARLQWELDEQVRRIAWECRAGAHGAEADAWRRARRVS